FTHWEENGRVVSYQPNYQFTVLGDRTIEEKTDGMSLSTPFVSITPYYDLRAGYQSYVGQYELPDGYEFIEAGFEYYLYDDSWDPWYDYFEGIRSTLIHPVTNEFLRSFPEVYIEEEWETYDYEFHSFFAYIVTRNASNEIEIYRSEQIYAEIDQDLTPFKDFLTKKFNNLLAVKITHQDFEQEIVREDYELFVNYLNESYYQYYNTSMSTIENQWYFDHLFYQYLPEYNDYYVYPGSMIEVFISKI